jgi:hypothetical protein
VNPGVGFPPLAVLRLVRGSWLGGGCRCGRYRRRGGDRVGAGQAAPFVPSAAAAAAGTGVAGAVTPLEGAAAPATPFPASGRAAAGP